MTKRASRILIAVGILLLLAVVLAWHWVLRHDQLPDDSFDVSVARPAYVSAHPRVMIDAAHHNVHTAGKRYQPFARLLRNDGYVVEENDAPLDRARLDGVALLVIANPLGAALPVLPGASDPAFTAAEIDSTRRWVENGGSLLLVADHEPVGAATQALGRALGVEMSTGRTVDPTRALEVTPGDTTTRNPMWIDYREGAGLGEHAILRGRDSTERVRRVLTFTGQSLAGPPGSVPLLVLSSAAQDWLPDGRDVPAAGRAQGIAFELGKGRVVVLGEAAMMTAQTTAAGQVRFGMSWPGADNKQFALNTAHWLTRRLE